MSIRPVAVDVDPEEGVMLQSDFIILQTRWTAFFFLSPLPITEASYDMILQPCTIQCDLMLVATVVGTI